MDLNLGIISEVEKKLKKKLLIEYMYTNLKHHNFWAYRYFFCELLSLINVGGNLQISRKFFPPIFHTIFIQIFQVRCFSWTVSSTALSSRTALKWCPSPTAIKKIASIPWSTSSRGWPSAPSTNLARPGTLKNTTHFVFCRSTLSTRRSTSSSGSGYFSSVSKPLYLPHLLFKKQRKPLRKLLLPFLSTFFPPLNRKKVKRNLITEHDTSAFPKLKMNDLVSFFFPRSSEFLSPCVSSGDHLQSVYPSVRTTTSVPSRQAGMYRNGHRKVLCRRLVPHLFDGTKHRLRHFQSKFY